MAAKRFRLLLVDDEPDVLELLSETFADGYDVVTAPSGWKALDTLRADRVDLLITDQRMPSMTGVQLIERAKAELPQLPCIILTAYTDPVDLIAAINRGHVYRYITKPWDVADLVQTVESALEEVALRRENEKLLAEAERRLAAMRGMVEVFVGAGTLSTYGDVVDAVTAFVERVVPLDVGATLVRAEPNRPATLTLRLRGAVSDVELQRLKDEVLERYRELSGLPLADSDVLVRLSGRAPEAEGRPLASRLSGPLISDGRVTGVLAVAAHHEAAFSADEERLLDVLGSRTADVINGLRTKTEAERRRMHDVVEGMADGLIMTDASGEVVVDNAAARVLLAVPKGQALTAHFLRDTLSFYPFDLVRGWERTGAHAVAEDVSVGERVLHSVVSPVVEPDGRLTGVVVVLRDVTEERQLERKKEDFVADVSHELRTPLTAIKGALELVLRHTGDLSEEQRRFLSLAHDSCKRLGTTIDDLLDLAKAARAGIRLELALTRLDELVADAVARYEAAFQLAGVQVIAKRPSEPVRVLLDPARVTQVLNNLLANALKFTAQGQRVEVEVYRPADVTGTVAFSVWNDGAHIEAEDHERIFQQFEQAQTQTGRRVRGTGLGLPISRAIVEAHQGRLWVESAPGKGARFVATLPEHLDEHQPTPVAGPKPVGRERGAVRVLVVGDDRASAFALKGALLATGQLVDLATTVDEALVLARRHRPTGVVVDVRQGGIDGGQLIEILRHDPDTRACSVLAVSSIDDRAIARRAGAHAFLDKPLEPAKLGAVMAQRAQARREGARVLIVDDDEPTRALCRESLKALGYAVAEADSAERCLEQVAGFRPDLILLDIKLPDRDGFSLIEGLKADLVTSQISVIFISASGDTRSKVRALQLGGDDYVVKPFDAMELCARVENVLRRRAADLASPTTRLPSSATIDRAVTERIKSGEPFTLCYLDLDNLKAFNDYYGYAKADGVVQQTGDLLKSVVAELGGAGDFLGHIAGDDFVFVTTPDRAQRIATSVIEAFDRIIPLYYDRDDRTRGYIETDDRYGQKRKFPIMSVSLVGVTDGGGRFESHAAIAVAAAALKRKAKAIAGSVFLHDDGNAPSSP
ncbi:MAG: hypothetical protein A2138_08610 [Deltaproteobacteria bacterium RBG_16_71_12]|nr:MAG: hypothetical protein A2138_08610 [Deltaproteobacteria bacterium RBG_16_71_12]